MLHTQLQPNIPCCSGGKNYSIGLANISNSPHFFLFSIMVEFYHSEVLKPSHAACEI